MSHMKTSFSDSLPLLSRWSHLWNSCACSFDTYPSMVQSHVHVLYTQCALCHTQATVFAHTQVRSSIQHTMAAEARVHGLSLWHR